jgi:hypothetical protein
MTHPILLPQNKQAIQLFYDDMKNHSLIEVFDNLRKQSNNRFPNRSFSRWSDERAYLIEVLISKYLNQGIPTNVKGKDFPELDLELKTIQVISGSPCGDTSICTLKKSETILENSNFWNKGKSVLLVCVNGYYNVITDIRFLDLSKMKSQVEIEYQNCLDFNHTGYWRKGPGYFNDILVRKDFANSSSIMIKAKNVLKISDRLVDMKNNKTSDMDKVVEEVKNWLYRPWWL